MKENVKDARITVRLPQEVKDDIREYCNKHGITISEYVITAISQMAEKQNVLK